jgi:hypothetical protein
MIAKLVLGSALAVACGASIVLAACSSSSSSSGPATAPCPTNLTTDTCPTPPPSWKTDVQPLFEAYCLQCHGNGGMAFAQVPLATYQDVFDNRTRSWQQVYQCLMPNMDASLPALAFPTADQRQTMITWLDPCNAPNN